jgi:hypothetical protein
MASPIRMSRRRGVVVAALTLAAVGAISACAPPPPLRNIVPVGDQPTTTAPPATTTPPTTTPPTTAPPTTAPPEEPATAALTFSQLILNESESYVSGTVTAPSTGGMRDYVVTFTFPDGVAATATVPRLEPGETGGWSWRGPSDKSGRPTVTALSNTPSSPTAKVNDGFSGRISSATNSYGPVDCNAGRIDGYVDYTPPASAVVGVDVITNQGEVHDSFAQLYPQFDTGYMGWSASICTWASIDPAQVRVLRLWIKP